jgi:transposase-like protein
MKLLVLIICIAIICWIEHDRISYLNSLPKEKRDELIKEQSQMRCKHCMSTDFEVVGMKRGKLQWQCKHCKKIK